MFFGLELMDWVLIVALLLFAVAGWRKSFLTALGGVLGFLAGAAASFFAIPLVFSWIPDPNWRVLGLIVTFIAFLALGHGLGEALATAVRGWLDMPRPRWFGRSGGALVNLAAAGLAISALAFTFATLGLPFLSTQIASSKVITTARALTPPAVERALGEARTLVAGMPLPELLAPVVPPGDVVVPQEELDNPELQRARQSVLRITGTATACGVNQTGSAFVVAPDRILTNAHVVEGVEQPVVDVEDGRALTGKVVAFDPVHDVAVVAVDGLNLEPLALGPELSSGDEGVFMGFPAGGPFSSQPAAVQSRHQVNVPNIYGADPGALEILQLAANVQQGNSGGPLLTSNGKVAGMIFAKAKSEDKVGYALSRDEIRPFINQASSLTQPVSTGTCTAH
ncbi:MarP family serine protease [Galactobacter caseinivorans]|nr:MarP family serine protease [Galactobacter caseinivorans]